MGLLVSVAVLALMWFGVSGVLITGPHTDLMYLFWPSSLMLTIGWNKTLVGITLTIISVDLNILMYGQIAILLRIVFRLSLGKSN